MLCELSQLQLKRVAVGKERLARMNAFELKEHDERLNSVIEQCKAREPHKFWDTHEVASRAVDWKGSQFERRIKSELRSFDSGDRLTRGY